MRRTARLPLEQLAPYLLPLPTIPKPLSWTAVFGNDRPVEIEVGFGKGLFLVSSGQQNPEVNYLGIEIERSYQLFAANRLARRKLSNVRLACFDARTLLRDFVPEASVRALHVYFPDPWWKRRHHKRRVFTQEFAAACARVLVPCGQLHIASDVGEYFAIITELMARQTELQPLPPATPEAPQHDLDYLTHFERKYRKAGKPIFRAVYCRGNS